MRLVKALPDLASAALLFAVWSEPQRFGVEWFRAGVLALLLEFFVIHAGGFMAVTVTDPEASKRARLARLFGWTAGYLAFVSLFALGFGAWWMVWAFLWFCFSKVQAIWTDAPPTEQDRSHAVTSWALSVAAFLGAVAATAFYEDVPQLGVSAQVAAAAGFDPKSSALWEAEPHRGLAAAVLYFTVMGLARPPLAWAFASR